jgi:hypothetical protein
VLSRVAGAILTGRLAFALAGLIDFTSALAALFPRVAAGASRRRQIAKEISRTLH